MNYLELIRMNMSSDELITICTNLFDIIRSDVVPVDQFLEVLINTLYKLLVHYIIAAMVQF